jgi:A/G-specific adenine glycosylase
LVRAGVAARPYPTSSHSRRYFRSKLQEWHLENERNFPWRRTRNPYHILVAEILLQQTDAVKVAATYKDFIGTFKTPRLLAHAEPSKVLRFISRIGLDYRAKRLILIARQIDGPHNGKVPSDESLLMRLPGVGQYIARAVQVIAFDRRAAVVDTNVIRVIERFFGVHSYCPRPRTDPRLWATAQSLLPKRATLCRAWNLAVLDFAALVCRHHKPRCAECPCRRRCHYVRQAGALQSQ